MSKFPARSRAGIQDWSSTCLLPRLALAVMVPVKILGEVNKSAEPQQRAVIAGVRGGVQSRK